MRKTVTHTLAAAAGAGLLALLQYFQPSHLPSAEPSPATPPAAAAATSSHKAADYSQTIERIRQSATDPNAKFWTTLQGTVSKLLKDDREGDRHQRFLIAIAPDITLLVAHNIDLAARVPVETGQTVTVSGEYVWNNKGGVMHWTHHDPQGRRGGWIEYGGKRYE